MAPSVSQGAIKGPIALRKGTFKQFSPISDVTYTYIWRLTKKVMSQPPPEPQWRQKRGRPWEDFKPPAHLVTFIRLISTVLYMVIAATSSSYVALHNLHARPTELEPGELVLEPLLCLIGWRQGGMHVLPSLVPGLARLGSSQHQGKGRVSGMRCKYALTEIPRLIMSSAAAFDDSL